MKISCGIEVIKKDSTARNFANENNWASWNNRVFDMWVTDYLFRYKLEPHNAPEDCYAYIIPKELLLQMANDILAGNFNACQDSYEFFSKEDEEYAKRYGIAFKTLAENLQDDELLRYYDSGD